MYRLFLSQICVFSLLWICGCSSTEVVTPPPTTTATVSAEQLFAEALSLQKKGQHALAVAKYGEAIQEDPNYVRARLYQAGCQFQMEKYKSCHENLQEVFSAPQYKELESADRANACRLKGQVLCLLAMGKEGSAKFELLEESDSWFRRAEALEER